MTKPQLQSDTRPTFITHLFLPVEFLFPFSFFFLATIAYQKISSNNFLHQNNNLLPLFWVRQFSLPSLQYS